MARYAVLVDGEAGAYGVVFPDLPGCNAMGATVEAALLNASTNRCPRRGRWSGYAAIPRSLRSLRRVLSLASVPLVRATGRPIKANLSLDAGVLAAIDAEATRRKLTRSGLVELLARHALADLP